MNVIDPPIARRLLIASFAGLVLLCARAPSAEIVTVRHLEGLLHGFLTLRSPQGDMLATGDLMQGAVGDRVTIHLVFRFKDGSLSDETTVFSQRGSLRLLTDHLVQSGPAFEQPLEMTIDRPAGHVIVRYKNEHGEPKVEDEHMTLPPDLANGMMVTLLKNVPPGGPFPTVSLVAATPKPRLVKVVVSAADADPFLVVGATRMATHFVLKAEIGGIAGFIAPLVGKQPPDSHVWILEGEAPAFVRSQSPMFMGAPLWQTDLVSPTWPPGR